MRVLARWIDFNLPFYEDWQEERRDLASRRRLLPPRSEDAILRVLRIRCRGCHVAPDLFRSGALNLSRPHLSALVRSPLPRSEGGSGRCRKAVFAGRDDPFYRVIMEALLQADSAKPNPQAVKEDHEH
jgi:hypothetical protein